MPQAIHIDGPLSAEPVDHFSVKPGESLAEVFSRLGVTARIEEVPAKPRKPSPEAERFIRSYQREDAGSVLAVYWRHHSLEAEEFDTVDKARCFLESGLEYETHAGEAIVDGDQITVWD